MNSEAARQVTILPAQFRYLARLSEAGNGAIGVSQNGGSSLTINTGARRFEINAQGEPIHDPKQERLC